MIIIKCCPRCGSIDKKGCHVVRNDFDYECQMCGKLYLESEAKLTEFAREKRVKRPKVEEPWLFPGMKVLAFLLLSATLHAQPCVVSPTALYPLPTGTGTTP